MALLRLFSICKEGWCSLVKLRNGYYYDVGRWYMIYVRTGIAAFVYALIFTISAFCVWGSNTRQSDIIYNEYAAGFNALPEEVRRAAAPFATYEILEGETTLPARPVSDTFATQLAAAAPIIIGLFLLTLSAATFFSYGCEKERGYFLADLPLRTPYGWGLLMSMFAAWPILAISAIRMTVFKRKHFTEKK